MILIKQGINNEKMIPKGIPLRNMNNDKMSQIIKPEIQPLEPAEIDQMLKEAKKDDYCNLIITVLFIGMRQEELLESSL